MTRDEILNMPAGREMDALIENIIFRHSPYQDGLGIWRVEINDETGRVLPKYTTNIAAAWEVVEQLVKLGFWVSLSHNGNKIAACWDFRVVDEKRNIREIEIEHTAPLAICRAALLAVMEAE